jgi:DNA-binding protein H-NS
MHGLERKNLSIEALASLRGAAKLLGEKIAVRQKELQGEAERLGALVGGKVQPKAPAKYRKGADSWSGRGSRPAWVQQHLDAGGSLEELKA